MKHIFKKLLTILVICLFCTMALGSNDAKEEEQNLVINNDEKQQETLNIDLKDDEKLQTPTIEEQVLFEYEGIKITAKEITKGWAGPQLKILIENNAEKNIKVSLDAIAVNDYMVSAWLYEEINAGKKSNVSFDIFDSKLTDAGITNIGKIDLYFDISDSDSYKTIYESDKIEIRTSLYDKMDSTINDIGAEILNQNGIKIIGKGVSNDPIWGSGIVLYIENNTDTNILVKTDNIAVNGFMVTSFLYSTIKPSKKAVETVILSSSDLKENDIEKIESLSLNFDILNADNLRSILKTDELTFVIE